MKSIPNARKVLLGSFIFFSPLIVFAQTVTDVPSLFTYVLSILNGYVVPVIFAIAFIVFIYGVYRYFIQDGGNAEKVQEGQRFVMWSIIGFVIMFSIWGIINLFINTLGFGKSAQPAFPTFNGGTGSGTITPGSGSISCLFGGCSGSGSGSGGTTTSSGCSDGSYAVNGTCSNGSLLPGSTYTSGGNVYPVTGANTVQALNGKCPNNFTLIPGTTNCQTNTSSGAFSGPPAISGIPNGGSCSTASGGDGNCEGFLICTGGTCQPDPNLENGDGTLNSACVPPGDCDSNYVCDTNSDTCQNPNTPGVNDGTTNPNVGNGTLGSSCIPPGDCDGDLVCDTNSDTCESPSSTNVNDGGYVYCTDGSTVTAGNSCVTCPDGSTSADASLCPAS
jgi:hypothetical protein